MLLSSDYPIYKTEDVAFTPFLPPLRIRDICVSFQRWSHSCTQAELCFLLSDPLGQRKCAAHHPKGAVVEAGCRVTEEVLVGEPSSFTKPRRWQLRMRPGENLHEHHSWGPAVRDGLGWIQRSEVRPGNRLHMGNGTLERL